MEELRPVAREALDAFENIASSARDGLKSRGVTLDNFTAINEANAEKLAANLREHNLDRNANLERLRHEPAIARLVIEDEDEQLQTLYISPAGTVASTKVPLCSYMSPKGRLAPLGVGDETDVPLPGGARWFTVREKMTFRALDEGDGWDSKPAVHFRQDASPISIKSLREMLREEGHSEEAIDALGRWLDEGDAEAAEANEFEGIKRDALTAMQLRIAPILDKFQDTIFRLPIDSQIAVLGPPGTGKTTTMVRRLRQKLDFAYLDDEEREKVEGADAAGLSHAESWILFTPTELLRLYVKEALSKEGVPAHDARLQTWDDFRRAIARDTLGILRKGKGGGFTMPMPANDSWLNSETLLRQAAWFDAFQSWQTEIFIEQMAAEAEQLSKSDDERVAILGKRVNDAIRRSAGNVIRLLAELAGMRGDLVTIARRMSEETKGTLAEPLKQLASQDPGFLDDLSDLIASIQRDESNDEEEDEDGDDEEGDEGVEEDATQSRQSLQGRRLVADTFQRAMRSLARQQASSRKPAPRSTLGRIVALLEQRGLPTPQLKGVGKVLLVQRAAGRLAGSPTSYLRRIPARYRQFRRVMRAEGLWYGETKRGASQIHPAEVDVVILSMLRAAMAMESDRQLSARLSERRPQMLDAIAALQRNQVLVDEATDFSPVQLAVMVSLANPATGSIFLSGDFNQRLTVTGSKNSDDLEWAVPSLDTHHISVTYRQSRKLSEFARNLAESQGGEVNAEAPDYGENLGYDPVFCASLSTPEDQASWLAQRIEEIQQASDGKLPTIAVLVPSQSDLVGLTGALNVALSELSLTATASHDGSAIGKINDVRVFPIEHIKGLEFEAVFFVDTDSLAESMPELFDRYLYVGATRAATFLGLTSRGPELPTALQHSSLSFAQKW